MAAMSDEVREAFLAEPRVGILAMERKNDGPLLAPVWYRRSETGDIEILMANGSAKAALLRRAGRASLSVQDENRPYRYVSVSGPVELAVLTDDERDAALFAMASRYLGEKTGRRYADAFPGHEEALVTLHPTRWHSDVLG